MMWMSEESEKKYPNSTTLASQVLINFQSSYLVECGFSVVTDLLQAKRNRLEITKRGRFKAETDKIGFSNQTNLQPASRAGLPLKMDLRKILNNVFSGNP